MTSPRAWLALAAAFALIAPAARAATAPAPSPRTVIDRAAEAMGGLAKVRAAKSLVMEGLGENPNLLQQMSPEAPLLAWMLPTWRRSIDLEHGRTQLKLVRRPAFPAVFDNWGMDARLDGDTPFDAGSPFGGPETPPRRAAASEAASRRVQMLHHPLSLLRAAMDPAAKLTNARRRGAQTLVDVVTARGDRVTLAADTSSGLPYSVASMSENVLLGDVTTETRFSGWEVAEPSGLRLPKRLTSTVAGFPEYDIGVMTNVVDGDVSDLVAPPEVRAAAAPVAAQTITATPAAKGVWMLAAGGYASVLIELSDHLALMDAPQGEARALALFAKARELVPGKPLTQLIVSHFHVDHAGGVRTAIAEGLTLVVQSGEAAFFRDVATRPFTIQPDALARRPRPLKLVTVDDAMTLKDAAMEVRLLHARHSTHGDTLLMAWFPQSRVLAQADLWLPGSRITPHAVAFADEIAARGLSVDSHLALHGAQIKTGAEFETLVAALRAGTLK